MGATQSVYAHVSSSPEYFAYQVLQCEYSRRLKADVSRSSADTDTDASTYKQQLNPTIDRPEVMVKDDVDTVDNAPSEVDQERFIQIYHQAKVEKDIDLWLCRCPSVIIYKYLELYSEGDRALFLQSIVEAATSREKKGSASNKKKKNQLDQDYSKSFGGTAEDTKNEQEAAALLRGTTESNDDDNTHILFPFLTKPSIASPFDLQQLRQWGRWGRYMGNSGCYLYIHSLTKEVLSIKPEDFNDDDSNGAAIGGVTGAAAAVMRDPSNGLPTYELSELPSQVDSIVKQLKKTPLIIDCSSSQAVRAFYSYKALLEDVSMLTVPFGKSGIKKEDIMERCRSKLVAAMKTGTIFALYLGNVTIEHADFKTKLCKKNFFPKEVFQHGGYKLLQPEYDPIYKALFREADLEAGQAIARDGFSVVVISSLDPYRYQEALQDAIPLGYMHAFYVPSQSD